MNLCFENIINTDLMDSSEFENYPDQSLWPYFVNSTQIEILEKKVYDVYSKILHEFSKKKKKLFLRKEVLNQSAFKNRFIADTDESFLIYYRPDGIFKDNQFFIFEMNISSSSYGLSFSETVNKNWLDLTKFKNYKFLSTLSLFVDFFKKKYSEIDQLVFLNWTEPHGGLCDTETEIIAKSLNHLGLESKVHNISKSLEIKTSGKKIAVWKSYHSPDQLDKNYDFDLFWNKNHKNPDIIFLDSINEIFLQNKFFLSQIDQMKLDLPTMALSEISGEHLLSGKYYIKLGNSAASHGVIQSEKINIKNIDDFYRTFDKKDSIVQKDLTEEALFPVLLKSTEGLIFNYFPMVLSPLFLNHKIIGFINYAVTPWGKKKIPTFIAD